MQKIQENRAFQPPGCDCVATVEYHLSAFATAVTARFRRPLTQALAGPKSTLALLEIANWRMLAPVKHGDTIHVSESFTVLSSIM